VDELDPAVTEEPGAMETDATVPEMVLARVAPLTEYWASARLALAVSMAAWSTAICCEVALTDLEPPETGTDVELLLVGLFDDVVAAVVDGLAAPFVPLGPDAGPDGETPEAEPAPEVADTPSAELRAVSS
jgi:hypothetical protein